MHECEELTERREPFALYRTWRLSFAGSAAVVTTARSRRDSMAVHTG
jgi:hypothetical protein